MKKERKPFKFVNMTENELRLNNWVLMQGAPHRWTAADFTSYFGDFQPIPLTPELLEKAGFDVSFWGYNKAGFPFSIWHYEGKEEMLVQYNKTEEEICYVTYLHELQNLYHAITGKELEIEL